MPFIPTSVVAAGGSPAAGVHLGAPCPRPGCSVVSARAAAAVIVVVTAPGNQAEGEDCEEKCQQSAHMGTSWGSVSDSIRSKSAFWTCNRFSA